MILSKTACRHKELCYDSPRLLVVVFNLNLSGGEKMSFIADISAIGTAVFALGFSLWMLKELFKN
jgi:hypothetical protein